MSSHLRSTRTERAVLSTPPGTTPPGTTPPGTTPPGTTPPGTTPTPTPSCGPPTTAVPWGPVLAFVVLAMGLAWLAALPLYLGQGLATPHVLVWVGVMMFTPALAGLIVTTATVSRGRRRRALGISGGLGWRKTTTTAVLAAVAAAVLATLALLLGSAFGLADLTVGPDTVPSLLLIPLFSVGIGVTAVGEELGWRGYLHTALRPLGPLGSQLMSGLLWGLWHAPLLLLGYNYATTSPISLPLMVLSTVLIGTLLAWLRERTGTVWAGALAHGAMNATTSYVVAAFVAPEQQTPWMTVLGWPGWIVTGVAVTAVVLAGGFAGWTRSTGTPGAGAGSTGTQIGQSSTR